MVQISSLFRAIPILSHLAFSSGLLQPANGLAVRQGNGVGDLPTACQSPCQEMYDILNTDMSLSEFCTTTVGNVFEQCLSCIGPMSPTTESYAQGAITDWNIGCNGTLSLTGSSGGSTTGNTDGTGGSVTNGTPGGTVVGPSGILTSLISTLPTTSSTPSSSSNAPNPSSTTNAGVAIGLETGGIVVCIVAAIFGAFVSL